MKKFTKVLSLVLLCGAVYGQSVYLPGGSSGIGTSPNSNAGIGTATPNAQLEIVNNNLLIRLRGSQASTNTPMDVVNLGLQGATGGLNLAFRVGYPYPLGVNNGPKLDFIKVQNGNTILATGDTGVSLGNVGIGTSTPDSKLAVKGVIHAQEVRIDLLGAVAPDYVFKKDYKLLPLSDLELYINLNSHLPEVPSASDMEKNGMLLKEMNLTLLKKVEELTLYIIEQEKRLTLLESNTK